MNLEKINVGGNEYDICDAKTRAMVSDEYDPEGDYVAGDLCIHDNKLHEAKGPTTGAWDSTKWEGRTLAEVLKSQNSNFIIVETGKSNSQQINKEFYIQIPVSVPEGYEICGVLSWSIENRNIINITRIGFDESNVIILGYCESQYNINPYATVLCKKN